MTDWKLPTEACTFSWDWRSHNSQVSERMCGSDHTRLAISIITVLRLLVKLFVIPLFLKLNSARIFDQTYFSANENAINWNASPSIPIDKISTIAGVWQPTSVILSGYVDYVFFIICVVNLHKLRFISYQNNLTQRCGQPPCQSNFQILFLYPAQECIKCCTSQEK